MVCWPRGLRLRRLGGSGPAGIRTPPASAGGTLAGLSCHLVCWCMDAILREDHGNQERPGTAAVSGAARAADRPDGARGSHGGGATPRGRGRWRGCLEEDTGDTFQAVRHRWGVAPVPGALEGTQREGLACPVLCV